MTTEPSDSRPPGAGVHAAKFPVAVCAQPWLLGLVLACGILVGANPFRPSDQNPDLTARGYLKFKEILSYVDRDYVDSVNAEELSDYAIARMLERLDPHSVFIPAKRQQQASSFLQSDYDGIGVEFNMFRDTVTVVAPLSEGPAEQAGLQPGDRILSRKWPARFGRALHHRQTLSASCAAPGAAGCSCRCCAAAWPAPSACR